MLPTLITSPTSLDLRMLRNSGGGRTCELFLSFPRDAPAVVVSVDDDDYHGDGLSSHRTDSRILASMRDATGQGTVPTIGIANEDGTNEAASRLLKTCAEYGRVGSKLTDDQRATVDDLAYALGQYSDRAPARFDQLLRGRHELIYSASPGASSGALGPLVGTVSQSFVDEVRLFFARGCVILHTSNRFPTPFGDQVRYINRVELFGGLFRVELNAERELLSESKVRVKFRETAFYLLGNEVKRGEANGSGVWDYIFSGFVNVDGEKMLLRVMKTPSTFVIVQRQ